MLGEFLATRQRRLVTGIRSLPGLVIALGLVLVFFPSHAQAVPSKIAPALLAQMTAYPTAQLPVIVVMSHASAPFARGVNTTLAQLAVSILQANGQPIGGLPIVDAAAGYANAFGINAMSALPEVAEIQVDAVVKPRRPPTIPPPPPPGPLDSLYPRLVKATDVWLGGGSGRGITVAVFDSGIAPDPDLTANGNRLVASVNFAEPRDPAFPDPGGHGTNMAGIIAGDAFRSDGAYPGIAPRANVIDVRVLTAKGQGRYSSMLRGMSWVLGNRLTYNIRIANMSFGAPPQGSYQTDLLAAGAEILWRNGIVVVAASGNGGPGGGTVESPGTDPHVVTVGSTDDHGTLNLPDNTLATWSAWGTPTDSTSKPDIVAPGRKIVSLRVPGSTLDMRMPDHQVTAPNGADYFRVSGTSPSTAVVSGAAALLLENQPGLKPDQVKAILSGTGQAFGQNAPPPPAGAVGGGLLNAQATYSPPRGSANQGLRAADDLASTLYPALYGQPLRWRNPNYLGINWLLYTWPTLTWDNVAWDNMAWDNIAWDNIAWDNMAWDNIAWDNIAWDNIAWDNIAWDNIAWDNIAWD